MDMAFDLEVKQHFPQAEFQVVARFGRDVIDRIRIDQPNELKYDKPARKVIRQSRCLLLRNIGWQVGKVAVKGVERRNATKQCQPPPEPLFSLFGKQGDFTPSVESAHHGTGRYENDLR